MVEKGYHDGNLTELTGKHFGSSEEDRCEEIVEEEIGSRDEFNERVVGAIMLAAGKDIPKTCKSVPWWNEDCSRAIKGRNRTFIHLKKQPTLDTMTQYKRAQAVVRKTTHWQSEHGGDNTTIRLGGKQN